MVLDLATINWRFLFENTLMVAVSKSRHFSALMHAKYMTCIMEANRSWMRESSCRPGSRVRCRTSFIWSGIYAILLFTTPLNFLQIPWTIWPILLLSVRLWESGFATENRNLIALLAANTPVRVLCLKASNAKYISSLSTSGGIARLLLLVNLP